MCFILRSSTLQNGFSNELSARSKALESCKRELEVLYAEKLGENEIKQKPDLMAKVENALRRCDASITSYNGTMKSIKLAIVLHQH